MNRCNGGATSYDVMSLTHLLSSLCVRKTQLETKQKTLPSGLICGSSMQQYPFLGLVSTESMFSFRLSGLCLLTWPRPLLCFIMGRQPDRQRGVKLYSIVAKCHSGDSSQDEEEEVQAVTVKFARPESEEAKARRLASYEYIQHRLEEDPWCPLTYHNLDVGVVCTHRVVSSNG